MRSLLSVFLSASVVIFSLEPETFAQLTQLEAHKNADASNFAPFRADTPSAAADKPLYLWECEGKQCEAGGGGGAIWVFDGKRGEAVWQYGAVADLSVERLDKGGFVVHRSDPIESYSTGFTGGKQFTAEYSGTITQRSFRGKIEVGPFIDKWYGGFTDGICDGSQCPLDARHLVELGENALGVKLYAAAFLAFKAAARRGDYEGEAFAAIMIRDGVPGIAPNPSEALRMLTDSADHGSVNGARGLSEMYEFGIATPKDPAQATLWKHRALERLRALEAESRAADQQARQRAQAERNKRTDFAIGATVFGLLILGALVVGGASSQSDDRGAAFDAEQKSAAAQLKSACDYGDAASCSILGIPNPN